jgi:hypothetical protein
MRKVTLTLPDEVYYEFQAKAGKQRRDTEDYMQEILTEESGVTGDELITVDTNQTLREFVLQWDWPNGQLKQGSEKADNVVGVVKRMKNGFDFPDAIKRRAKQARNEDPKRGEQYNKTVRADCSKRGQGVTSSANQFRREVKEFLHDYEQRMTRE